MVCGSDNIYRDWDIFLEDPSGYPERLQEAGRTGDYMFYQVVLANPNS
jgi:hypothetical protein